MAHVFLDEAGPEASDYEGENVYFDKRQPESIRRAHPDGRPGEKDDLAAPLAWMSGVRVITGEDSFLPIRTTSLVVDAAADFDLYTCPNEDAPPVLYRERSVPFTAEDRDRLEESGVVDLFVTVKDETKFWHYIESNLRDILRDKAMANEEKASLAYHCSQCVVADLFDDPRSSVSIDRSKTLIKNMAEFLLQDESSVSNLMRMMSFDYYTYTHSVNVCIFSLAIAQFCGIKNISALCELGEGALLHDIGKSQLDPELVAFDGTYTEEQHEEMKAHTVLGYELLEALGRFSPITLSIVRSHHERFDGTGYPDGLEGDGINHFVRICAIAELFDSLTSRRPYKEAAKSFDALKLMRDEIPNGIDLHYFESFVKMLGDA